jgi:HSP20 family protein
LGLPDVFDQFQRDFDTIMQQFYEPTLERGWVPTGVEIWEDDNRVHLVVEMPGIKTDDIDITLDNNVLTVRGEKREEQEHGPRKEEAKGQESRVRWHMRSRSYGQFMRQFQLPTSVDESKVTASFKDGLLHIEIEKRPEVKPKKIEVKSE